MIKTKFAAFAGATALAVTALTGVQIASAPTAEAASCKISTPLAWSVYNQTCAGAQHFNVISGKSYKYAPRVGKAQTSRQAVCWANMTGYGARVFV